MDRKRALLIWLLKLIASLFSFPFYRGEGAWRRARSSSEDIDGDVEKASVLQLEYIKPESKETDGDSCSNDIESKGGAWNESPCERGDKDSSSLFMKEIEAKLLKNSDICKFPAMGPQPFVVIRTTQHSLPKRMVLSTFEFFKIKVSSVW